MFDVLIENYRTYVDTALGRPERHFGRFALFAIIALLFALFGSSTESSAYSMMATGVTVLMGFTFTALFSDHALVSSGLPKSKNENDRHDLARMEVLSKNFRIRSSYFIFISILEIVLLVAVSFSFDVSEKTKSWSLGGDFVRSFFNENFLRFFSILFVLVTFVINFVYLECLYTFYRTSETILAIVDARRNYLKASREDEI